MTEKVKELEGMKAHLPIAHGISKMNHSFFWTFEVLYNPLKNMISISLGKTLCYRIQSWIMTCCPCSWEHTRKYCIVYCTIPSVFPQEKSFKCWSWPEKAFSKITMGTILWYPRSLESKVRKVRGKKNGYILKWELKQRRLDLHLERAMESTSRGKLSRSKKGNRINGCLIKVSARNIEAPL